MHFGVAKQVFGQILPRLNDNDLASDAGCLRAAGLESMDGRRTYST
jgi:hypothetical protein